jgi:putative hemolysin
MEAKMAELILQASAILFLILLNGFFALSEMSLVASRRIRLKAAAASGDREARSALHLKDEPERFLSTVQIGITLIGILTGTFSGATIATELEGFFAGTTVLAPYSRVLGIALVVIPVTYLTLILGELVPKRMAIAHPERWASMTSPFMAVVMRLSLPLVHVLSVSTGLVARLFGIRTAKESLVTEEDIRGLINEAAVQGIVEHAERDMLERIFRLGDRQVTALMTHRSKVVWLDPNDPVEDNKRKVLESPFSRFPVAKGDLNRILGVVKGKEFLSMFIDGQEQDLTSSLHRPLFVPENMRALKLLEKFKQRPHMHLALVMDEFGDIQGIVTLNDFLESIVGDIPSTGKAWEPAAVQREDGSWLLDGLMPVDEVQAVLGLTWNMRDEEGSYQTLAGFILKHFGRIPEIGEYFDWKEYRFEIVDMDGRRIDRILMRGLAENSNNHPESQEKS